MVEASQQSTTDGADDLPALVEFDPELLVELFVDLLEFSRTPLIFVDPLLTDSSLMLTCNREVVLGYVKRYIGVSDFI